MHLDERKAVKKLKQGSGDALEWLIARYAGYVNTVVRNVISGAMSESDIEETVSDVFFRALAELRKSLRSKGKGLSRQHCQQQGEEQATRGALVKAEVISMG